MTDCADSEDNPIACPGKSEEGQAVVPEYIKIAESRLIREFQYSACW